LVVCRRARSRLAPRRDPRVVVGPCVAPATTLRIGAHAEFCSHSERLPPQRPWMRGSHAFRRLSDSDRARSVDSLERLTLDDETAAKGTPMSRHKRLGDDPDASEDEEMDDAPAAAASAGRATARRGRPAATTVRQRYWTPQVQEETPMETEQPAKPRKKPRRKKKKPPAEAPVESAEGDAPPALLDAPPGLGPPTPRAVDAALSSPRRGFPAEPAAPVARDGKGKFSTVEDELYCALLNQHGQPCNANPEAKPFFFDAFPTRPKDSILAHVGAMLENQSMEPYYAWQDAQPGGKRKKGPWVGFQWSIDWKNKVTVELDI